MKISTFFVIGYLSVICLSSISAQTINVKSPDGSLDTLFSTQYDLQRAIDYAPAGSTLILSAGAYSLSSPTNFTTAPHIKIDKELHIIGSGHVPDSTIYNGRTVLKGGILFLKGADNTTIEGFDLFFQGFNGFAWGFIFAYINQGEYVKNIILKKLKFSYCDFGNAIAGDRGFSNILISDCFLNSAQIGNNSNITISNNIIFTNVTSAENAIIENNIFLGQNTSLLNLYYVSNSVIRNNIFRNNQIYYESGVGNTENNNASTGIWPVNNNNFGSNNKSNVVLTDIFQNYSDENASLDRVYQLDLRIKPGSVAKNAGTDGKDLGIYGGDGFSVKPSIPFIEYKEVAKQTNAQGQLPVNIKVKAQGNN